jgi:NADPH:quinone reductase-like Zn-dependent oxidoreductase
VEAVRPFTVGWDVSGVVEQVGFGTTRFRPGVEVFGMPHFPRQACGVRKLGRACKTQQSDVWALRALGRPATSDRLGIAANR